MSVRLDGTLAARLRSGLRLRQNGHALLVHRKGGPDPAALALSEGVAADTRHRVVVADLPADAPLTDWQAAGRLLAGRTDGIRLVFAHAAAYDTRRIGQAVAETTGGTVLAADGTPRMLAGGGLFVPRDQGAGWLRFQPGRPPAPDSRRFPKPQWEFAAADEPWSPEPGTVVEPIAGGVWLRSTGDERGIGARHWLVDRIPAAPDTLTVVLGSPGTAPVSLAATVRLWHSVLPSARAWLRFLQLGPVTLPGNVDSCGQGLADAVGERVVFYAGVPALPPHAGDGMRIEVPSHDGAAAWQPFVTEILYVPGTGDTPSPPILLGLRAPVQGAAETSPGVYAYTPDTVLEVVQSGLWLRPPAEPADGDRVRRVAAAPGRAAILYDRRTPDGGARLRLLAEDMLGQLDPALRDAFRLAPADAPGAALGWSDTDWWAAADDGTARRAPGAAGGRLEAAEPESAGAWRASAGRPTTPAQASGPSDGERSSVPRPARDAAGATGATGPAAPAAPTPAGPPDSGVSRAGGRPPLSVDGPLSSPGGAGSGHEPGGAGAEPVVRAMPSVPAPSVASPAGTYVPAVPGDGHGGLPPSGHQAAPDPGAGPGAPLAPPAGPPGAHRRPTGSEPTAGAAAGREQPGGVPPAVVPPAVAAPGSTPAADGSPPAPVAGPSSSGSGVPPSPARPADDAGAPPPTGSPGAAGQAPTAAAPLAGNPVAAPAPAAVTGTSPAPAGPDAGGAGGSRPAPAAAPALPRLLRLESETVPSPAEPSAVPEELAVPAAPQPPPLAAPAAPGVRVQPVPAAVACAVPPARGLAQEREWVRKKFGARFNELSGSISRVLSESPGLQAGSGDDAMDVMTDLTSARLYLTGDHTALDAAVRAAGAGPHVPLARCVYAGLLRLPSYRGPVLLQARATAAELAWYEEGRRVTEWSFCVAGTQPSADAEPGASDFLLWSMTARRTRLLDTSVPDRVVLVPGTAFKVLRTDTEGPRPAVLLRELSASETAQDAAGAPQRVPLDDLALDGLSQALELLRARRARPAEPSPSRAARAVPLGVPPGLVPASGPTPPAPANDGTTTKGTKGVHT